MSNVPRALMALVLVTGAAGHAGDVKADPISDQKKVDKALGVSMQLGPEKCAIFTKSDAERVFRAPVVHVETEMDKTDCSWGLAKNPRAGVLVSREPRSSWYPPDPQSTAYSQVHHVTGVGQDTYTYYAKAGAGGVYDADALTS